MPIILLNRYAGAAVSAVNRDQRKSGAQPLVRGGSREALIVGRWMSRLPA
jgi:hypothetical protein